MTIAFDLDALLDALAAKIAPLVARQLAANQPAPVPPADDSLPDLATVDEAAAYLHVTAPTVRAWIASGSLRASRPGASGRVGRHWRIAREDLRAFARRPIDAAPSGDSVDAEAERILRRKRGR